MVDDVVVDPIETMLCQNSKKKIKIFSWCLFVTYTTIVYKFVLKKKVNSKRKIDL